MIFNADGSRLLATMMTIPDYRLKTTTETAKVVGPEDVDVVQSTGRSTLPLITCFPFAYVGPAPKRFVVRARETSRYVWSRGNRTTFRR